MADVKISELTALTAPDGAEELVVNDGGTTKKITIDNLFNQDIDVTGDISGNGDVLLTQSGTPKVKLIDTTSNVTTQLSAGNTVGAVGTYSDHDFSLVTNSTTKVKINADGNVGIGVDPEGAWANYWVALDIGNGGSLSSNDSGPTSTRTFVTDNAYNAGSSHATTWKYKITAEASQHQQIDGKHVFRVAPSGTADSAISWNTGLEVLNDGKARVPNGLLFGTDTAAANTLDDYESGTWTPVISDATSGGNIGSASSAIGRYVKVGNQVTVTLQLTNIVTTGLTASSNFVVQGLPFTADSVTGTQRNVGAVATSHITSTGTTVMAVNDNSSHMLIVENNSGAVLTFADVSQVTSGTADLSTVVTYFV